MDLPMPATSEISPARDKILDCSAVLASQVYPEGGGIARLPQEQVLGMTRQAGGATSEGQLFPRGIRNSCSGIAVAPEVGHGLPFRLPGVRQAAAAASASRRQGLCGGLGARWSAVRPRRMAAGSRAGTRCTGAGG